MVEAIGGYTAAAGDCLNCTVGCCMNVTGEGCQSVIAVGCQLSRL